MHIEARHVFWNSLRVVKAALHWYPDSITMQYNNASPLGNAISNKYQISVIKCLLRHGANLNAEIRMTRWYYHMQPISYLPINIVLCDKNWVLSRTLIQYGAKITSYVKEKYAEAPPKERLWFKAWMRHRDLFAALTPGLLERASYSYNVPPLEVKPGIIVPGRQGYQDSLNTFHAALRSNDV